MMAYNSAYTGSQVDAAVGAVRQKETIWDGKQDELTGTEDQLVGFNAAGEAVAVAAPDPLPTGGEVGQVLTKTLDGTAWDDVPSDLPDGGTDGQILTKTDDGVAWENPPDTGVISFNGRKGEVSPGADDYSASMIKFTDGQTFQQKYDAGQLTGPAGANGSNGEDGGYYQPAVDGSGNLTWTASKSGMPAVSGANIKGATGPAGTNGKDATINGQTVLNLLAGAGIDLQQSGQNITISSQGAKLEYGTYTGNGNVGGSGVSGPPAVTLTFSFKPRVVFVAWQYQYASYAPLIFLQGQFRSYSKFSAGGTGQYYLSWIDNSVSWWSSSDNADQNDVYNHKGYTYTYIAIG